MKPQTGARRPTEVLLTQARPLRTATAPLSGTDVRRRVLRWAFVATVVAGCGAANGAHVAPSGRLDPSAIDDSVLVTLAGNTHPDATPEHSLGPAEETQLIEHMQLVLQRSPAAETALETAIDALHDTTSPTYHQWLTAAQFGDTYGVDPADVAVVSAWLESHGLRVDSVPTSRMFIEFSGTVAQIRDAFHTRIDRLSVRGSLHFANMSDPQIPSELAKTVVGVHALHDFMPHSLRKDRGQAHRDHATGTWRVSKPAPGLTTAPLGACYENANCKSNSCNTATGACNCAAPTQCSATLSGAAAACTAGTCVVCRSNADCDFNATCNVATSVCEGPFYAVAPADFATIYNVNPLFAEGITGRGQTVVVIEDTNIANTSDVAAFRAAFGLSGYVGTFSQVHPPGSTTCTNPGVNADEGEAALDAEWAGASAPDAAIELASCADAGAVFGGLIALQNLLNSASPPPIVSISYGECEAQNGAAANQSYVNTYQQAATLGTSVFVSTGDEGAASCDANKTVATHGIAVSGFASTPYNVAVGGTDFMDLYDTKNGGPAVSTYWSASNSATFASARSYVPEVPWNDSCASGLIDSLEGYAQGYGATGFCNSTLGTAAYRTTGAGSGGPSNFSAQPTWQTGVFGLPTKSGGKRYLPDVSLFAADGVFNHFYVYCMTDAAQGGGPCTYTNLADTVTLAAGGTSFSTPAMAGIQALINQKMAGPQGNPTYTLYKLAGAEQGATGSARCNSSGGTAASPLLPEPGCIFNDVTQGDIDLNCTGTNCFGAAGANQGALSTSATALAPAYGATKGWDFATGLGSVNAYNLVTAWSR